MTQGTIKDFDEAERTGTLLMEDRSEVTIDAVSLEGSAGAGVAGVSAAPSASVQAVSAGRIRVAIWPGATRAAWMAAAPSPATVLAVGEVLTQCENGRAMPSTSFATFTSSAITVTVPDSILERSRMSVIRLRRSEPAP